MLEMVIEEADQQRVEGLAEVAEERAKGLTEVAKERAKGMAEMAKERAKALAEVEARRAELEREVEAMHQHKEAQEGRVELNIGGYRFQTSVQALRRVSHTFFDAYFSGRYAQDVCDDSSIFVDRDGEHFGHVLEYMRDGHVSVAESGADPSVSLVRALKREFGFYCIGLCAEVPVVPEQPEMAYVLGGGGGDGDDDEMLSSMERFDASSGRWSTVAAMGTARSQFSMCVAAGELYATGGTGTDWEPLTSVEKYSPSSDSWSVVAPLPEARHFHAAVAVGSALYVLGGRVGERMRATASVLKLDTKQGTWIEVAPMPMARADCVFRGADARGYIAATVLKYDTVANAWRDLAPMPRANEEHSVSVLDGLVYIVGNGFSHNSVLRYDPASGEWRECAPTLHNRRLCSTFVLGGCLYAAGSDSGEEDNPARSSVECYDTATNTWTLVASMLEEQSSFGAAVTIGSAGPTKEQDLFDSLIEKASSQRP
jgi:hypothetical protein